MLPAIAAVPGVRAAGATSVMPFSGSWSTASFEIEGYQPPPKTHGPWGDVRIVTPGFFETAADPAPEGTVPRRARTAPAAGASRSSMRSSCGGTGRNEDPLGKRFTFGPPPGATDTTAREWIEVVGVVGHTKHEGLDAEDRLQLYLPYRQRPLPFLTVAVRTAAIRIYANPVRRAVQSVDPDQPISNVRTMEELIAQSVGQRRLSMLLLSLFSGIALVLASVGIYGRHELLGGAALARARRAHRPRRGARRRAAAGAAAGDVARPDWAS